MHSKLPLVMMILLFLLLIASTTSQFSRIGAVGGRPGVKGSSSGSKQTSMVLPAVLQVLQSMSEQVEDFREPKKGVPKGGISGHQIPPYLLRVMVLRNSLITAAKKRKMSSFSGYSEDVMPLLVKSSEGTAGQQLKMLLEAMLEREELASDGDEFTVKELARTILKDLEDEKSDLSRLMEPIKPVKYSVD